MKQREKELKKKLKKQKAEKSTASSTNNNDDDTNKLPNSEEIESSDVENDLPEQYIEEIVTERQFIDSDGQVKTEVTTVEVSTYTPHESLLPHPPFVVGQKCFIWNK